MKTDRPVSLTMFPQPISAIVSISHRATGVALFVGIAFALYALDLGMSSPEGFAEAQALLQTPLAAFILLGLIFVLMFHIFAGIKHLLLDFHVGDTFAAAKASAIGVIVLSVLSTVIIGATLW